MKTILITGATDGIGLATAQSLAGDGHRLILHGRSEDKLRTAAELAREAGAASVHTYTADFADLEAVAAMASRVSADHDSLDVLINNAGVYKIANPITPSGHDIRYVVNTFAPIVLTRTLMPLLRDGARVLNLSSAAQSSIDPEELSGQVRASREFDIYGQSKLALTMWTRHTARQYPDGPQFYAINPGSMLASKMVTQGFGVAGNDIAIGVGILREGALSKSFEGKSGAYFDNDRGNWGNPHPDALNEAKVEAVLALIEAELVKLNAA